MRFKKDLVIIYIDIYIFFSFLVKASLHHIHTHALAKFTEAKAVCKQQVPSAPKGVLLPEWLSKEHSGARVISNMQERMQIMFRFVHEITYLYLALKLTEYFGKLCRGTCTFYYYFLCSPKKNSAMKAAFQV